MSSESRRLTEAELRILAALWERGPATVREVHAQVGGGGGYTTTLKFMQIMTEKGLLTRDERGRAHIYRPAIPQDRTQKHLVSELIEKAFGGSMRKLMIAALSAKRATPEELREIAKLIDEKSKGR